MLEYRAPERDFEFLLFELYKVQQSWQAIPAFADFTEDLLRAVLAEGGKLAADVMAPLNQSGDEEGCQWADGEVRTPKGFKGAMTSAASLPPSARTAGREDNDA